MHFGESSAYRADHVGRPLAARFFSAVAEGEIVRLLHFREQIFARIAGRLGFPGWFMIGLRNAARSFRFGHEPT